MNENFNNKNFDSEKLNTEKYDAEKLDILDKAEENYNGQIIFNIDVMLAKRKMSVTELANKVGITIANMSILKTGKAKAIKISTLIKICEVFDCQPGDILEYRKETM